MFFEKKQELNILNEKISNMNDKLTGLTQTINNDKHNLESKYNEIIENQKKISEQLVDLGNILTTLDYINFELYFLNKNINRLKVLICGFYGADNLGDELMLQTIIEKLSKYNNIDITILVENNRYYDVLQYDNIHFLHYLQSSMDYKLVADYYDKIIFGGGALIDDSSYNIVFRNYVSLADTFINLSKLFIKRKKEVYLIALSSSDKLTSKNYIEDLKYIVSNATYVSLRDKNSYNYLKKLKIDTKKVNLVDDLIFANGKLLNNTHPYKTNNSIGLVLIYNEDLFEYNRILIEQILNNTSYSITLIPFYNYLNNDTIFIKRYCDLFNNERITYEEFTSDINKLITTINNQKMIISERYHGALLSTILNKKTIALVYDNHCNYVFKMNYIKEKYNQNMKIINISEQKYDEIIKYIKKLIKIEDTSFIKKEVLMDANKELNNVIEKIVK